MSVHKGQCQKERKYKTILDASDLWVLRLHCIKNRPDSGTLPEVIIYEHSSLCPQMQVKSLSCKEGVQVKHFCPYLGQSSFKKVLWLDK